MNIILISWASNNHWSTIFLTLNHLKLLSIRRQTNARGMVVKLNFLESSFNLFSTLIISKKLFNFTLYLGNCIFPYPKYMVNMKTKNYFCSTVIESPVFQLSNWWSKIDWSDCFLPKINKCMHLVTTRKISWHRI